jgi:TPR repeat protein
MMNGRILFMWLAMVTLTMGQAADPERISRGDPLTKVYTQLGTPVMEYPLDGTLVLEYAQGTIVASNNMVISAEYKPEAQSDGTAGDPREEDKAPTIDDIKQLAMQGDVESQYILAYCFQLGKAIEQDYDKAVAWYRKAAMQGHMASQHNLGFLYMSGRGVEKDLVESYMWALLAEENGNDTLRSALDHRLSEEQKLAGQMRAEHMRLQMQALKPDSAIP